MADRACSFREMYGACLSVVGISSASSLTTSVDLFSLFQMQIYTFTHTVYTQTPISKCYDNNI